MDLISRLEVERSCAALSHAFTYHLDQRDYGSLARLFTSDGVWFRHGVRLQGPDEIIAKLSERVMAVVTRHVTTNIHFTEVQPDLARAVVCIVAYFNPHTGDIPAAYIGDRVMVIDFEDVYVNSSDGWHILERVTRPILIPEDMRAALTGRD